MPPLKIIQRLFYKPSNFESMLEKYLFKFGVNFAAPNILRSHFEDVRNGVWRQVKRGDKFLVYKKLFRDESEIIKEIKVNSQKITYIDEKKLLYILNKNKIYSEDITFTEKTGAIALIHYPASQKLYTLDFKEEAGIALFIRLVNDFYGIRINPQHLKYELFHYGDETKIEDVDKILNVLTPNSSFTQPKDYLEMIVKGFVR